MLNGETFYTLKEAKMVIANWLVEYTTIRPHGSLGYRPPAPWEVCLKAVLQRQSGRRGNPFDEHSSSFVKFGFADLHHRSHQPV